MSPFQHRLTSDDYGERHPLAEDILRCACALAPEYTGLHLNTLTQDQTIFEFSIDALFEMNAAYIGDEQLALTRKLFTHRVNRMPLLRLAHSTIRNVEHPLNVEFWDTLLSALPMPERDISWTELIRSLSDEYLVDLGKFEQACQEIKPLTDLGSKRLDLAARYFRWLLSSTNRLLRDTATRALYWYGRSSPTRLFELTIESLPINDPYIPERMLAASYGVTMALHADPRYREFSQKLLPPYARQLYDAMFAKDAPYATTHALMRDFAKHTIDLAILHQPNLLGIREQRRLKPPYKDGGIRKWGKNQDRNKGQYNAGSGPLHMDFRNYTLGRLILDSANYDDKHAGYYGLATKLSEWLLFGLLFGLGGGLLFGLARGLGIGLLGGLRYGGRACLYHFGLRLVLWHNNFAPLPLQRRLTFPCTCPHA